MVSLGSNGLIGMLAAFETVAVRARPAQCTTLRHRKSTCSRCTDVCPTGAISWARPTLQVDASKCSGCGMCVAVCPTGALEGKVATGSELVSRARTLAKDRPAVAFACKTHLKAIGSGSDRCVEVNCLGRLDESVLVASIAWGAGELLLAEGSCAGCPESQGRSLVEGAVARSRSLLAAFGSQAKVAFVAELPAEMKSGGKDASTGDGVSRRDFFGFLAGKAKKTTVTAAEAMLPPVLLGEHKSEEESPTVTRGVLPVYQGERRRLLLTALSRLGQLRERAYTGEDGFWLDFRVTPACTGCRMCAQFCPTGALATVDDEQGRPALSFTPAKCTACGLCRDLCLWKAVEQPPSVDLGAVLSGAAMVIPMPSGGRKA